MGAVEGRGGGELEVGEVEGVAVGELGQAVDVEVAEEVTFPLGERGAAEVDDGRRGGLVVRHAG
ncbi:MAG: hypothetical protein JO345_09390 [Streptosporangiaceae bacterium]|nr:hypothetical protein [Streptosporangiaceae bacterium]